MHDSIARILANCKTDEERELVTAAVLSTLRAIGLRGRDARRWYANPDDLRIPTILVVGTTRLNWLCAAVLTLGDQLAVPAEYMVVATGAGGNPPPSHEDLQALYAFLLGEET